MNYLKKIYLIITLLFVNFYAQAQENHGFPCIGVSHETVTTSQLAARATKKNFINKQSALVQKSYRYKDNYINQKANQREKILSPMVSETLVRDQVNNIMRAGPAQSVGLNFTAATVADVQDPTIIPPNPNGWVGPDQYILMMYQNIRSFDKNTGLPDGVLDIDAAAFFNANAEDVNITYDRFSQRWFVSCENLNDSTGQIDDLILGVSNGSVITQCSTWDFYRLSNTQIIPNLKPLGSGNLDYSQLAIDAHAVYLSVDTFNRSGNFLGTSTVVVKKSSLLSGKLIANVFPAILPGANPAILGEFTPPANNFDADSHFGYIINASNFSYPSGNSYNKFYLYRIGNPSSNSPILGPVISIPVPNYTDPANAPYKGNVFGSVAFLQTSSSKLNIPHIRNHQLYVCHNIQVDSNGFGNPNGDRVGVRWYQFDLTGDATGHGNGAETIATVPALVQWGTLYDYNPSTPAPKFYYIPSIMTNKNGDLVIACTVSSAQDSPNVVYTGRFASDPKGSLRSPVLLTSSTNSYNFGPFTNSSNFNIGQRWGDQSSVCPEPDNDLDFWTTQEFAAVQNGWGIQVTQLQPL